MWEQWVVPVRMTRSLSSGGYGRSSSGIRGSGAGAEQQRQQQQQRERQQRESAQERAVQATAHAVRECLLWVLDAARQIEHVPPVMYSFQLQQPESVASDAGRSAERPEGLATRVLQTPGMFDK